jgi:hypothetical protein
MNTRACAGLVHVSCRLQEWSAERHPFHGPRWLGVRKAHHPESVEQADERGDEREQQRDLKGEVTRVGVDADDLVLDLGGLRGQ